MEVPAELVELFDRLQEEEKAREPWTFEKGDQRADALARYWSEVEEIATPFVAAIEAEIEAGSRPDLEPVVDFLTTQDRRVRSAYLPRRNLLQQIERDIFRLPQSTRVRALAVNRRQIAAYNRVLEGVREFKKRLTALRDLVGPVEEAPALSEADELDEPVQPA